MRSGFFDNTEVRADDFAVFARGALTSGLICDKPEDEFTGFMVTPAGGMSVRIQPGFCWLDGHFGCAETAETLTLDPASGTADRYDRIVARLNYRHDSVYFMRLRGEDGGGVPDIVRETDPVGNVTGAYDIGLAIVRVRAGTVEISDSMITDTRGVDGVCEYVRYRNSEAAIIDGKADKFALEVQTARITALRNRVNELEARQLYFSDLITAPVSTPPTTEDQETSTLEASVPRLSEYRAAEIAGTVRAYVTGGTVQSCAFNVAITADAGQGVSETRTLKVSADAPDIPSGVAETFVVTVTRGNNIVRITADGDDSGVNISSITLERVRGLTLK